MKLRDYQITAVDEIEDAWSKVAVVLARLDTGAGKTLILKELIDRHSGFICAIAHRGKLVEQISMTLARAGIRHDLIASEKTKRLVAKKHVKKFGQCFYVAGARCRVASVDTLRGAKEASLVKWMAQVTLWIVDEGHHVLRENKWGKCVARFTHPACKGLLLTATPGRPDGKGLGRHADGFADIMVEGPFMRWLIDQGFLCDYDVVCPPTDLVITDAPRGSEGDYTAAQVRTAERASHIVGDIPAHYLRFAAGLSGITFVGSIETATDVVAAYREKGVSAELITGDTDSNIRDAIFDRAEAGELQQIVAVDVISEGVDIPALQVGSFARLTGSIITWRQQLGRLLRPIYAPGFNLETQAGRLAAIAASKKPRALLIDHIGGFADLALGPPDKFIAWTLDAREKKAANDDELEEKRKICANPFVDCFKPFPAFLRACPHCGFAPEPMGRATPAQVDGDLQMLTPEALAALRGAVIDPTLTRGQHDAQQLAKGAQSAWLGRHWENYAATGAAQLALRESMDMWAGGWHARGAPDNEIQRRFFLRFGVDMLTAQALGEKDATALKERVDVAVNSV